jgi:SAM-dependent methyltransferase
VTGDQRVTELPFSAACERNKAPILTALRDAFALCRTVLEIGSGTGQHAVHFSAALEHLHWQPTDVVQHLPPLAARIAAANLPNCAMPLELDVCSASWPVAKVDGVFTANTLHIIGWPAVERLFAGVGRVLQPGGRLCVYGPFRYRGQFTSPSNAAFDASLRARDVASGVRDFEAVAALAAAQGLRLDADHALPANNQLLVWSRDRNCAAGGAARGRREP